jgi:carbon storage regulator
MLVLSRKVGERILIGDQIAVTIVRINGQGVRLGIEAPTHLVVVREELANAEVDALPGVGVTQWKQEGVGSRLRQ